MRRALPLCAALCALLHFGTGASLKAVSAFEKELDRLQPEIDLWIKLQNPAELNFPHAANASKTGLVIERPKKASLLFPNYEKDVVLYLFTRENRQATKVAGNAVAFKKAGWKASRPTYIAIHGFTNNIESPMFKSLVPAVLDHTDANVVAVDWGVLCPAPLYLTARGHVPKVGEYLGEVLEHLIKDGGMDPATTHIIGHSLGAHVAGIAGRTVKSGTIGRVTALDPAMPLFLVLKADRVGKGDAALVDVVHTCAGELGLVDTIGDVDFYPNGGSRQDGCGLDLTGSCSHGRSVEYFVESANEPDAFEAAECASSHSAVEGQCSATYDGRMGFNIKYNPNGSRIYYLQTASSAPFDIETHTRLHDSHE